MPKDKKTKIKSLKDFKKITRKEVFRENYEDRENPKVRFIGDYKAIATGLKYYRDDFNFDLDNLTPSQKRKIRNTALEYFDYTQRPNTLEIKPSAKNKKALMELAQQKGKGWKKVFIPRVDDSQKVVYRNIQGKKKAVLSGNYFDEYTLYWNLKRLAKNPAKEIDRMLRGVPENSMFMLAGKNIIYAPVGFRKELIDMVNIKMFRYGNYQEWMFGVKVISYKNQATESDYLKRKRKNKEKNILNRKRQETKRKKEKAKEKKKQEKIEFKKAVQKAAKIEARKMVRKNKSEKILRKMW